MTCFFYWSLRLGGANWFLIRAVVSVWCRCAQSVRTEIGKQCEISIQKSGSGPGSQLITQWEVEKPGVCVRMGQIVSRQSTQSVSGIGHKTFKRANKRVLNATFSMVLDYVRPWSFEYLSFYFPYMSYNTKDENGKRHKNSRFKMDDGSDNMYLLTTSMCGFVSLCTFYTD